MHYDPIKKVFGNFIRKNPWIRILFYKLLGVMFLREWHVKRELRRQLSDRNKPFTVYDAGSGFGQYSYYIAKQFSLASIYGIDLKEEQVADCNQFFHAVGLTQCSFAVEDLTQIQHSNTFDFILSVDVMEHIHDDTSVFSNFFCALKSKGTLFINTPSNLGGSDAHSDEEESFIGEHARNGYGVDEIREKLESAGFSVESIRYTYGVWGSRYWKLGIKYPMQMLNISKMFFLLLPFYYLVVFPIVLPMMLFDYTSDNKAGTGLNVLAKKAS
jgi:cyclopropane fatty-acyl-phospholipid synthase-like methyltransferase